MVCTIYFKRIIKNLLLIFTQFVDSRYTIFYRTADVGLHAKVLPFERYDDCTSFGIDLSFTV